MKNVIIVSPGRSGTSMTAGLFKESGYFFHGKGKGWKPDKFNRKGYFEDREINNINEGLLRKSGVQALVTPRGRRIQNRWLREVFDRRSIAAKRKQRGEMERLIGRQEPFCYKDPRFCYTLGAWRPYLNHSNLVFVSVVRDPVATAMSIKDFCKGKFWGMRVTVPQVLRVWACMFRHVVSGHRKNGTWFFLDYDRLLGDEDYQQRALDALSSRTGAQVDRSFICPGLRTKRDVDDCRICLEREQPELHEEITSLYGRLHRLCESCCAVGRT